MTSSAIRTITRNASFLFGARVINLAVRTIWMLAAARVLGPELYGLLAYSQYWQLVFLPLALFGVGPALSYLIGPDRTRVTEYAGHVLAIRLITIVIACAACVGLSYVVTPDPRAPALITVLSLVLAAGALTTFAQTLFTAFEINQYTIRQVAIFSVLDLVVSLIVLFSDGSLLLLVSARAAVAWLQTIWALLTVNRVVVPVRIAWQPSAWTPLLRLAVPALLMTLATEWCFNGSVVLFRNLVEDGVLFGQYALAMQVLAIATMVPVALSRAAFPALRRAVARGDGRELDFASVMQRAAPIAGSAAGLTGVALGQPVFAWLLGDAFGEAGAFLGLTLWCLVPLIAAAGYPEVMLARGRFRTMVVLHLAGATVMTSLSFILVPAFGVRGAVASALLGFCVAPVGAFLLAWREGMAGLVAELIRPVVAAIIGIGAWAFLAPLNGWAAWIGGLAVLAIMSFALRVISPVELQSLRASLLSGRADA